MANPPLESFGESPKAYVINSSCPPANIKRKENPDLPWHFVIGLACLKFTVAPMGYMITMVNHNNYIRMTFFYYPTKTVLMR